ncbi:MAG: glycosyltransferase family 4 protein [candidate division WOR-3 bacterium]
MAVISLYIVLSKLANALVVHAEVFREWLNEWGIRNVHIIPHGAEISGKYNEIKKEDKNVILCLGTIAPRKGIETLLQAVLLVKEKLKEKNIVTIIAGPTPSVLGDGEYLAKIAQLCSNMRDIVMLRGYLADIEVEKLLKRTLLMCLPYPVSIAASGPLMIAIGRGIPVITSSTPYFIEVLGEDYPLMFKPGDVVSLAKLLEAVLENDLLISRALSRINSINSK